MKASVPLSAADFASTRRSVLRLGAAALLPWRAAHSAWSQGGPCRFGAAEVAVTPSWGTYLWGYGSDNYSRRIRDDIFAKAFLFDCGKRFLWICVDVGALPFDLTRRVARRIHEQTGIDEDAISIQCTHTHYAPATLDVPDQQADRRFQDFLQQKLFLIAIDAQKRLTPAVFQLGQVDSFIALNRRTEPRKQDPDQPSGPIDPTMSVLLARSPEGKNLGLIVNYASHPVMLASKIDISADFPGVVYRELGAALHCPVMYSQGCCGDMVPKSIGDEQRLEYYGKKVATEAQRALDAAKPIADPGIRFAAARVIMTFVAPYSLDEFRANYNERVTTGPDYFRTWAERYLRYLEDGGDLRESRDTVVKAFSLGDLSMVFLPGEVLHLTSMLIRKQFPQRKLIVGGYANDTSIGYIPHADEFPKGGYEIDNAWRFYGTLKTTPEMEKGVRDAAVDLLRGSVG